MSDIPFYMTGMGRRFFEHTAPELVRQLIRLNDNLERLTEAVNNEEKPHETDHETQDDAETQPPHA